MRTKEEAALCRKVDKCGTIKDDKTNDLGLAVHHKSTQHADLIAPLPSTQKQISFEGKLLRQCSFLPTNTAQLT